jgi:hypothetical protein
MFRLLSKESNIFSIPVYIFFLFLLIISFNILDFKTLGVFSSIITFCGFALGYFLFNAIGCSYYLFCQELKNNPLFAQRMQDAVTAGMLLLQDKVRFLVEDNPDADPALLRVQLSAYTTLLKAYHPERFGDRVQITHHKVDVKGAITEAKSRTRVIDVTPQRLINPLDD